MHNDTSSSNERSSYEFFLKESSGIPFEQLAEFSQPLLELFDVDPHHWSLPKQVPDNDELVQSYASALAAAEVFWSYFTLDHEVRKRFVPELKSYFIGNDPAPHEQADFMLLVGCMEGQWLKVTGGRATSGPVGRVVSDLNAASPSNATLETLALFGEPLMDSPELLEDPDQLESIMARIGDYWALAHCQPENLEAELQRLIYRYADSASDRLKIEQEARKMLERYDLLFRDH